jgi:beta-1,3-galactosyltransferase 1
MLVPVSSPSRRPPCFILAIVVIFAVLSFHTLYYGLYDPSLLLSPTKPSDHTPAWLILTISKAAHLQRRHIIRKTWQRLYRGSGLFDTRFVIADPGPLWRPLIEQENATYGDLIMLAHEHETHKWANTVKTLEAFKHIASQGRPYTFVSKMDEDSWIDAKTFHRLWLEPRTKNGTVGGTYIGRRLQHDYPFKYASGQFYTLSWDMINRLVDLWELNRIDDEHEDVLPGRLLYEGKVMYNLTVLPLRVAFDYYDDQTRGDGTAWAPDGQDVDNNLYHGIATGSLNPHQLKDDEVYLRVAACYDENGVMTSETVNWEKYMEVNDGW